jgi:hypothetical protein
LLEAFVHRSTTAVSHMRIACMQRTRDISLIARSTFLLHKAADDDSHKEACSNLHLRHGF